MAGVGLDGGEDCLTGRSSSNRGGSKGSSNTSWEAIGETSSIGGWKTSREGIGSGEGSSDWGSIFNAANNLGWCSSIDTVASKETSSIGVDNDGCGILSLTLLPLLSRGSSSRGISSSKSLKVGSCGGGYLSCGLRSDGKGKVEDWSYKRGSNRYSRGNRQVGGRDSESIDRVSNVLGSLEESVSINILVGACGDSVGVPGLRAGKRTSSVSERELSELILSMELRRSSWCWG